MMRRRAALAAALALSFLLAPLAAEAQPPAKVPRIGYLSLAPGPSPRSVALLQGLRDLGYAEGKNITIEYRWGQGNLDRLRDLAAELVRVKVDVIVTGGSIATRAAKEATHNIPIVMAFEADPVGEGFVASLARPGGNITGLTNLSAELSGKRLELLKETVPGVSRVAVLSSRTHPGTAPASREIQEAARSLGVQLEFHEVRGPEDFEGAFRAAARGRANALAVLQNPVSLFHRTRLVGLAAKNRLPAIYFERVFVEAGGLMSYAASDRDLHRRAAVYVDKILKGTKPADLPVEQPTRFELIVNLKTAKALGLTFPPSIMVRADQVIQ